LQDRLNVLFERLETSRVPGIFDWLGRSPAVLEGVLEMIDANVMSAGVHAGLLREAVAIGVASRSKPGSDLQRTFERWLPLESVTDPNTLRAWAAPRGVDCDSDLVSACRRYAWQVANAAHTITDEQIARLSALGLTDAERLDLTLATAAFSALAIIEPIGAAVAPELVGPKKPQSTRMDEVEVQLA
jgi:alkylhydroperoxidase family enzyme